MWHSIVCVSRGLGLGGERRPLWDRCAIPSPTATRAPKSHDVRGDRCTHPLIVSRIQCPRGGIISTLAGCPCLYSAHKRGPYTYGTLQPLSHVALYQRRRDEPVCVGVTSVPLPRLTSLCHPRRRNVNRFVADVAAYEPAQQALGGHEGRASTCERIKHEVALVARRLDDPL